MAQDENGNEIDIECLGAAHLAYAFDVSRQTLTGWRARGMPAVRIGRNYKYNLRDCLAWHERVILPTLDPHTLKPIMRNR